MRKMISPPAAHVPNVVVGMPILTLFAKPAMGLIQYFIGSDDGHRIHVDPLTPPITVEHGEICSPAQSDVGSRSTNRPFFGTRPDDPLQGVELENTLRRQDVTLVFKNKVVEPLKRGRRQDVVDLLRGIIDHHQPIR